MKCVIVGLVLLLSASSSFAIESDKKQHAIAGAVVGGGLSFLGQVGDLTRKERTNLAMGVVTFIGVAKEVADNQSSQHTAEWQDAAYTIAGGVIGIVSTELLGDGIRFIADRNSAAVQVEF